MRTRFTLPALAVAVSLCASATAQTFNYNYGVGAYTLSGQFVTTATSGTTTKSSLLSNSYTVFKTGVPQYSVTFTPATGAQASLKDFIGSASGTYTVPNDFYYTIGASQFNKNNPSPVDPTFPIDFTVQTAANTYYGLSYNAVNDVWTLDQATNITAAGPQGSAGFASGPLVTAVPEPGNVALFVGMATFGAGFLRKRRK